jgi:shikimate dehydrogenase
MSEPYSCERKYVGCFGDPVWENPTEVMMNAAFEHHDLAFHYVTMHVTAERLADAVRGVQALGFKGFNCTLPHKVAVIQHLDGLGESAEVMGAVNCVVERDGKYIGENTDGKGFVASLTPLVDPAGTRLALFGAGGAARAISVEMALAGTAHITIFNRSRARGEELVTLLRERVEVDVEFILWDGEARVPEGTDIVVNATSIGLYPDVDARLAIDSDSFTSEMLVADVIPNPPRTRLVRDAEERGCKVIDGLGMLVNQGVTGIQYWSGCDPDPKVMRAALEEVFGA